MTRRVQIKLGATIFHDCAIFTWPDHKGATRRSCLCNAWFEAEPFGSDDVKLTRRGFGSKREYGSGAIITKAENIEP